MSEKKTFTEGQDAYVDHSPYGVKKTKVTRVTATSVRTEYSETMAFDPESGRKKGSSVGYMDPRLRHPSPQLERKALEHLAIVGAMRIENAVKSTRALESLSYEILDRIARLGAEVKGE